MATAADSARQRARRIWAAIRRIPRGRVSSYGRIAALAGFPRGARLAARALHDAPDGLPWFRVLNAQGRIAIAAGSSGAREQRRRLEAEGVVFLRGRVDLARYGWPRSNPSPLLD
jgi:methylated-DNA-protein-cysteine methyltransferase-like protein